MAHDPILSDSQRDHIGTCFSHIQSILICYKWSVDSLKFDTALDIGCGEGYGADILNRRNAKVVAADIHYPSLQIIKNTALVPVCTDAFMLGFTDNSFDLVIGSHIIEHFDDEERNIFLKEIIRVIKLDGDVVIATPNPKKGYHYENSGIHKILYDKKHLHLILKKYFNEIEVYGVYPRKSLNILKGFFKKGKQILKITKLFHREMIKKTIAKTSIATTDMNFYIDIYKPGAIHIMALCRGPRHDRLIKC